MSARYVLWDWNGTLLDDVDLCVDALNRLLAQYGYPQQYDTRAYRAIFGFPIRDYYQRAGFDFGRHSFAELAQSYMDDYIPASAACTLMPGAEAVLQKLRDAGVRQLILSASPLPTLEAQVAQRGIRPYFEALLGLGDIYAKSKIDLGKGWLAQSGAAPECCVMVGDSTHDYEVSRALGTRCLLYCGGHQTRAVLEDTGAPVFDTLGALCDALLNPRA